MHSAHRASFTTSRLATVDGSVWRALGLLVQDTPTSITARICMSCDQEGDACSVSDVFGLQVTFALRPADVKRGRFTAALIHIAA